MKGFAAAAAVTAAAVFAGTSSACTTVADHQVTFYGFPDNSPPSTQVAHNCGGRNNAAGGSGTYADPLTFATAPGEYSPCEILYLPLLKKYIRYEDDCEQCGKDYKKGQKHIDIWTGNSKSGGQKQIECENELTSGGKYSVVRQPPQNLEVDSSPLWDGSCHKDKVYESNKASCDAGSGSGSGTKSPPASNGDDNKDNKDNKDSDSSSPSGFKTSSKPAPTSGSKDKDQKGSAATTTPSADSAAAATSSPSSSGSSYSSGSQDQQGGNDGAGAGAGDGDDEDEDCEEEDEDDQ